jgi:hypothetical protein
MVGDGCQGKPVTRRLHLLVTGTYRSGTTLAERLLDNLADGFCAPQPFPYLYLEAKRRFLTEMGIAVHRYPIGTGFHDPLHRPDELADFLRSHVLGRPDIEHAFDAMRDYSGAQSPELADVIGDISPGPLGDVVRSLHDALAQLRSPSAVVVGSKEILLEEFIPTFRDAEIGVPLVIRDPRATVASTFGPAAAAWSGRVRPLLHTILLWRKSVAYSLRYREGVAAMRLEDLVAEPESTLRRALHALGATIDVRAPDALLGADGNVWPVNTSFPDGATPPGSRFGLSDRQLAYVEALTRPEMLALGYEPLTEPVAFEEALDCFMPDDDPGRSHPDFDPDISTDPERLDLERRRIVKLRTGDVDVDETQWFVLSGVGRKLASALANGPEAATHCAQED